MAQIEEVEAMLYSIFEMGELILATLSEAKTKNLCSKVVIRPILVKNNFIYQITEYRQKQALHSNFTKENCIKWLLQHVWNFKQSYFYTLSADYHLLVGKKDHCTLLKNLPTKKQIKVAHNRQKKYQWQEGVVHPFLVHLKIMSSEGRVYPEKRDKFRQINRFLEMIEDILPHLEHSRSLHVIDFGCGKAYLTFALYNFLKITKGFDVKMIGLDLKSSTIQQCQEIATALDFQQDLKFVYGDINDFESHSPVDMVVALHACDTATDAAIEKAILMNAKVILAVPCCQHEVAGQIQQKTLAPLLKYGILKDRFAALVTDAARAQLLESLGYQTQILEFIDVEHTPKNLLIRAIKRSHPNKEHCKSAWKTYLDFKSNLQINPSLERRIRANGWLAVVNSRDGNGAES